MINGNILAIANQKGGVCKTTSCFTIGNVLADKGKKVLLIDMDPQASLTLACGVNELELKKAMHNVMTSDTHIEEILISVCGKENLFLAPASIDLAGAEMQLVAEHARELILKSKLNKVKEDFDVILIDCSPSLGILVANALTACDKVVIPCSADYLSYKGLTLLLNTINKIKVLLNPSIDILGVIVTMFAPRTLHCKEILEILQEDFNVLGTVGTSVKVKDAFLENKSITDTNPKHSIAKDYIKIVEEIINE